MSHTAASNIRIVEGRSTLTEEQNLQFRLAIMEGLKGKFATVLQDEAIMLAINDTWIKYGFYPMDETFCAIDGETGEVLAILLLNNFKEPGIAASLKSLTEVCRIAGVRKAFQFAFAFDSLGRMNSKMSHGQVAAEIYLVATREAHRGKGAGTALLSHVLEYVKAKCRCGLRQSCTCKAMLLVFNKNPAKRLYERFGFEPVHSMPTPKLEKAFGSEYDAIVRMERFLKQA